MVLCVYFVVYYSLLYCILSHAYIINICILYTLHLTLYTHTYTIYTLQVGQPHYDFKQLEASVTYEGGSGAEQDTNRHTWDSTHPIIQNFWSIIHSLTLEQKQKFLLFVTGSSKSPIGGLAKLGMKIQRMGPDSELLPTSHTCFNTLLLPEYNSIEKLKDRLIKAINECEGFGLK